MPTVCFEHVVDLSVATCLLGLDASNSDDQCTWKSLFVGVTTFKDLPLLIFLKVLANNALNEALCPRLKKHTPWPLPLRLDPESYHDSMRCLIEYMLATPDSSMRRYLNVGAHHGEGDNCFIKYLVRTLYQLRGFGLLADW